MVVNLRSLGTHQKIAFYSILLFKYSNLKFDLFIKDNIYPVNMMYMLTKIKIIQYKNMYLTYDTPIKSPAKYVYFALHNVI